MMRTCFDVLPPSLSSLLPVAAQTLQAVSIRILTGFLLIYLPAKALQLFHSCNQKAILGSACKDPPETGC